MRLQGKVAIVTGGGRGIGRGIALMFAREGARVAIASRTVPNVERVVAEIEAAGGEGLGVPTDVADENQMKHLVEATHERFGGLDILVNNAGIGFGRPIDEATVAEYTSVMDTNLKGMFLGCHFGVPLMKAAGKGSIISISSVHGVLGYPRNSMYAATKGGIIGSARSLAAELAPFRIRVNVISPGAIWLGGTPEHQLPRIAEEFHDEFMQRFGNAYREWSSYTQPLEKTGEADDIAYCATYLASDESLFVTGQNIVVDGGLTTNLMHYPRDDLRQRLEEGQQEMEEWIKAHASEEEAGGT